MISDISYSLYSSGFDVMCNAILFKNDAELLNGITDINDESLYWKRIIGKIVYSTYLNLKLCPLLCHRCIVSHESFKKTDSDLFPNGKVVFCANCAIAYLVCGIKTVYLMYNLGVKEDFEGLENIVKKIGNRFSIDIPDNWCSLGYSISKPDIFGQCYFISQNLIVRKNNILLIPITVMYDHRNMLINNKNRFIIQNRSQIDDNIKLILDKYDNILNKYMRKNILI